MPFVISNPTAGLFTSLIISPKTHQYRPSFSKRPNAAFTFYPTREAALAALLNWPSNIEQRCSIFHTERDFASISDLLAHIARNGARVNHRATRREVD